MGSETKTVIGVMSIVGGEWAAEAPNVLAVRGPAAPELGEPGKGDLFVLVELHGGDPASADGQRLCRSFTERVRDVYYEARGGAIASLRRALAAAEAVPLPVPSQGTLAGLTAVVVRGVDVFIASAGPMVVYVVAGSSAARFPERTPVSQAADGQLEPFFFHTTVAPRDLLVLGDSRFAALAPPEDIAPAVARQDVEDALANLGDLVADQDCTTLVVEVEAGKDVTSSRRRRSALHGAGTEREGGWDQVSRPARAADIAGRLRRSRVLRVLGRGLLNLGKGSLAFFALVWSGLRALFVQMLPERRADASAPAVGQTGLQSPPARVRTGGAPPLPAREKEPAPETGEVAAAPPPRQRVLRALAIVIPIVIAIVAGVTYWRKGVAEESTFQMLMEQARTVYQQAVNADEPTARRLLDKSDDLLVQAAAIRPQDNALVELRAVVTRQQDTVNHVERLNLLGRLRTYDNAQTHLRRVVADGLDVYVLDNGADVVYHHRMDDVVDSLRPDEGDPVLVRRAQQVGRSVIGELLDITWVAAAPNRQAGALMILEAGGLLEYLGNRQLTSLAIGGRERWVLPVAVMGYGGNFYILDAQAGQIFRYRPGEGGYPDAPESYLSDSISGGLVGAVDMAIDGYIYVLYADGSVRKFEGGAPAPFDMTDFDRPFNNPTAIFTAPDQQVHFLYVADAGNRRIVQMEKSGRFVRQLKPRDEDTVNFEGIKSIFVDELAAKMYLVDNRSLYIAGIPRIQQVDPQRQVSVVQS